MKLKSRFYVLPITSLFVLIFFTNLKCKNQGAEETIESQKTNNSNKEIKKQFPFIVKSTEKTDSFFLSYFKDIVNQKILPVTKADTLLITYSKENSPFQKSTYETNFGFWGNLYWLHFKDSKKKNYVSIISADQYIWGSQYYLAAWEKNKNKVKLIDKVELRDGVDSFRFVKNISNDGIYTLEIFFEKDLTSAYGGQNGISFWKLEKNKFIKWKDDELKKE